MTPFCHRKACETVSPGSAEVPVTWPEALIARALLQVPPSVPRSVTV